MIHILFILIIFLWNVFCLSSKPKTNAVEKQKHNNDNNQRLVRVFLDAIEIHATQTEPYLHRVGSCARKSVFSTAELKLSLKNTIVLT